MAGVVQKFDISDNVMLVPMMYAGTDLKYGGTLFQGGLYAMYGFDAGHWLYANPKTTFSSNASDWVGEVELGGGYMLMDNVSVGFKYEMKQQAENKGWVNAFYYF
ncbi:hypothetical protein [Vibrio variabilis]|uniref:hypothetical protein n=1 Tax=Vibrio variabilis TaxID=990271 RepID=UPI0013A6B256|nr:hypothetical protein [Vibrio variabilis]